MGRPTELNLRCERILRPRIGQRKYEEWCVAKGSTSGRQILVLGWGGGHGRLFRRVRCRERASALRP
jgi:hypothetical protein